MKNHLLYLLFSLALLSSCNTSKEIIYFQDVEVNSPEAVAPPQDITVQPKDQISIVVSSKDPELAALFNLTRVSQECGGGFSLRRPKFSLLMRRTDVVFFPCRKKIAP